MAIFNEELWTFIESRYGGEKIKRFWNRKSHSYYTQVDIKLQQLRVCFLNSQQILEGDVQNLAMSDWWTQISNTAYLKDLKSRLVDSLNSAGLRIGVEDIRLWLYNS